MKLVRVSAAVIEQDGRFLVCRRAAGKRHGGLWEFPGGKLEEGETIFAATSRELREELAVQVLGVGAMLCSVSDPESRFVIEFIPTEISGDPQALEHSEIRWADLNEVCTLELAPSDRCFVEHLTSLRVAAKK